MSTCWYQVAKENSCGYNWPEIGRGIKDVCQTSSLRCLHNQQGFSVRGISGGEREGKKLVIGLKFLSFTHPQQPISPSPSAEDAETWKKAPVSETWSLHKNKKYPAEQSLGRKLPRWEAQKKPRREHCALWQGDMLTNLVCCLWYCKLLLHKTKYYFYKRKTGGGKVATYIYVHSYFILITSSCLNGNWIEEWSILMYHIKHALPVSGHMRAA